MCQHGQHLQCILQMRVMQGIAAQGGTMAPRLKSRLRLPSQHVLQALAAWSPSWEALEVHVSETAEAEPGLAAVRLEARHASVNLHTYSALRHLLPQSTPQNLPGQATCVTAAWSPRGLTCRPSSARDVPGGHEHPFPRANVLFSRNLGPSHPAAGLHHGQQAPSNAFAGSSNCCIPGPLHCRISRP